MQDVLNYIEDLKKTQAWANIEATVEASPWHREANVAVHTEMVLDQYIKRFAPIRSDDQNRIALLALVFHDFGKPSAEEELEKKDGSGDKYRRYAGHEQDSAVAFTEQWLKDDHLARLVDKQQARVIRWIIEHHLPYGLKDSTKVAQLRSAVASLGDYEQTFFDCLRSDAAGRISDDHETKLQNVENWIATFQSTEPFRPKNVSEKQKCFILIGPSGSGKSTFLRGHARACDRVISRDSLYRTFWEANVEFDTSGLSDKDAYSAAWQMCCIDNKAEYEKVLQQLIRARFESASITKGDVFIDNTNGSKKARALYVQFARQHGMKVVAVEFWNRFDTLVARQTSRPDKEVPISSVKAQVFAQTCAWLGGEADEVVLITERD